MLNMSTERLFANQWLRSLPHMDAFGYSSPTLTLLNHVTYSEQENKQTKEKFLCTLSYCWELLCGYLDKSRQESIKLREHYDRIQPSSHSNPLSHYTWLQASAQWVTTRNTTQLNHRQIYYDFGVFFSQNKIWLIWLLSWHFTKEKP